MNGLRLTRRGWVVLGLTLLTFVVAVNWAMAGKNLVCDWRTGPTTCSVEAGR
jgi:hypothetical protein